MLAKCSTEKKKDHVNHSRKAFFFSTKGLSKVSSIQHGKYNKVIVRIFRVLADSGEAPKGAGQSGERAGVQGGGIMAVVSGGSS